jgi:hypothetical protein
MTKVNTGKVQGQKRKSDLVVRTLTAVLLLAFLVPLFVFASLPQIDSFGYDMFYISLLTLVGAYSVYELTNASHPYQKYNKEFGVTFVMSLMNIAFMAFVAAAPFAGIEVSNEFYFTVLSMLFVVQLGVYSAMRIDTTKLVIISVTTILITLFFNTMILASTRLA